MEQGEEPLSNTVQRVARESEEAGASKWEVMRVIKALNKLQDAGIQEMRTEAVNVLKELNPRAAEVYSSFNKMQVHTSRQLKEPFDRGHIIRSLLKETTVSRAVAERVGSEVEDRLKDLDVGFINTALIREMVNVRLLEYGHEDIWGQYMRLGMPVYDIKSSLEQGFFENKEVLTEYNLLKSVTKEASDLHFSNKIYIHRVEDFASRPYSGVWVPELEGELNELIVGIGAEVAAKNKYFSKGVSLAYANLILGSELASASRKARKSAAGLLVKVLNNISYNQIGGVPGVNLALFSPNGFEKYSKNKSAAFDFVNDFARAYFGVADKKFGLFVSVDSKYKIKLLDKGVFDSGGFYIVNSDVEELQIYSDGLFGKYRGLRGKVSVNVKGLVNTYRNGEEKVSAKLTEVVSAIEKLEEKRKEILEKRDYLANSGIDIYSMGSAICLDGLAGAAMKLSGNEVFGKEEQKIAENWVDEVGKTVSEGFIITGSGGARSYERFSISSSEYGEESSILSSEVQKYFRVFHSAGSRDEVCSLIGSGVRVVRIG